MIDKIGGESAAETRSWVRTTHRLVPDGQTVRGGRDSETAYSRLSYDDMILIVT